MQGLIVFTYFLLHFIDHLIRRDLTLIFMQLLSSPDTVENELWLLRGNSGGWVSQKSIRFHSGSLTHKSCRSLTARRPKSRRAGRCSEVSTLGSLCRNWLVPTIRLYFYYRSLSCVKASAGHPAQDPLWWPMHKPVSDLTPPALKAFMVQKKNCGKWMEQVSQQGRWRAD